MADIVPRDRARAREFRVSAYLEAVARHLPETLLPQAILHPILALTAHLPGAVTSFFGFECPLSDEDASADFLFCSTREEGHARILAGADENVELAPELLNYQAWQRVRAFCQQWEQRDSCLQEQIMNVWLEFDIASNRNALTCPSIFFGTLPAPRAIARNDSTQALFKALALLEPAAVQGARGATLRRLFGELPDASYAFQIGVMYARQVSAIRVCLRGLAATSIGTLLEAQSWPGPRAEIEQLVAALVPLTERLDVDLDVGASLGAKIGIECYFGTDAQTTQRLRRFGDYLVAQGLCTPAKVKALVRYNGLTHQDSDPADWPEYLSALAAAAGPGTASCLIRWVHHIKIVYETGKPLLAKAYLAIEHHALARRQLAAAIDAARSLSSS